VLFVLSIAIQARGIYEPANNWLLDFRMDRTPVAASGEIGIIAIDPQSLKDVGTWPWSRAIHGEILDRLVDLGAGVILFDVDFAFPSDPDGDTAFAEALDRAGGATLLASFVQRGTDGEIVYNQAYGPFYDRSWPAVVTVTPDENGQIRYYPTGANINGSFVPSAGAQLAGAYANNTVSFAVNYGISPQTVPMFSAKDLLDGKLTEDDIAGRSFLIGAAAAELGDHFAVPLHQVIPGVMIHAIAAETLLQKVAISLVPSIWLLLPLFVLLCLLQLAGRNNAWRLVSLAFLSSVGTELAALAAYWSSYSSFSTAMVHPALIMLAMGRLAMTVDFARLLIKRQSVQMENAESLRQHIFENSSDSFLAINRHDQVAFQSDSAKEMLGVGTLPPGFLPIARQVIGLADPKPRLDQLEVNTPTGIKSLELHSNASELQSLDDGHNLTSEPLALITVRDVTDLKQQQRQIEYLSRHDDRTSALRRHSFGDVIESRLASGESFAVAAIALRRLTALNAALGRDIGDQVLIEAVHRLKTSTLGLGEVARLEGNVFGVLIPYATTDQSLQDACRRIRDVLTRPYSLDGSQISIGLSIGYLVADPAQDLDGESYLPRAQDALADSKRDEFHLLYQPQYRLSDQRLIGAEALIRWESAEFGFVSPVEFIPLAESSGFISELGHYVLEESIKTAVRLPNHLSMSPNVSVFQLLSDDFPSQVSTLIDRYGLAPERLCLELTESEFLSPGSEAVGQMRDLQALGVTWALDDFGTGYSSLSYLKDLPFDKIKLDRSFLRDIFDDPMAQTALRSIVQLVQGYGKSLLCEGAETQKEVDLLTQFGCDSVQGYYFGRPEPFEDLKTRAYSETDAMQSLHRASRLG